MLLDDTLRPTPPIRLFLGVLLGTAAEREPSLARSTHARSLVARERGSTIAWFTSFLGETSQASGRTPSAFLGPICRSISCILARCRSGKDRCG